MGRYLLVDKEANIPYEVEELDLRLYTKEELCYYIYNNIPLLPPDFIDRRLLTFLEQELQMTETVEKLRRFYVSEKDRDSALLMLLSDVGYFQENELIEFQNELLYRKKKNNLEKLFEKGQTLLKMKRYQGAIRTFHQLLLWKDDARLSPDFINRIYDSMANCYGKIGSFDEAVSCLLQVYQNTKSEETLKKLYFVSAMSGVGLPRFIEDQIKDGLRAEFETAYREKEERASREIDDDPSMRIFFREEAIAKVDLLEYIDRRKEELRGMLI